MTRPLGPRQRSLLAALGNPHLSMVVPDARCRALIERGYARCLGDDAFVAATPDGLRALAAEMEAGRIKQVLPVASGGIAS